MTGIVHCEEGGGWAEMGHFQGIMLPTKAKGHPEGGWPFYLKTGRRSSRPEICLQTSHTNKVSDEAAGVKRFPRLGAERNRSTRKI